MGWHQTIGSHFGAGHRQLTFASGGCRHQKERGLIIASSSVDVGMGQIYLRHTLPQLLPMDNVDVGLGESSALFAEGSLGHPYLAKHHHR